MGLFAFVGVTALLACAVIAAVAMRVVRIRRLGGVIEWIATIAGMLFILPFVGIVAFALFQCPPYACTGIQGHIWVGPMFALPLGWIGIVFLGLVYLAGEPRSRSTKTGSSDGSEA